MGSVSPDERQRQPKVTTYVGVAHMKPPLLLPFKNGRNSARAETKWEGMQRLVSYVNSEKKPSGLVRPYQSSVITRQEKHFSPVVSSVVKLYCDWRVALIEPTQFLRLATAFDEIVGVNRVESWVFE